MARKQIGYTFKTSTYQCITISRLSVPTPPQKSYNVKKNQSFESRPIAEEHRVGAFCVNLL